jgi:hypothetical protein
MTNRGKALIVAAILGAFLVALVSLSSSPKDDPKTVVATGGTVSDSATTSSVTPGRGARRETVESVTSVAPGSGSTVEAARAPKKVRLTTAAPKTGATGWDDARASQPEVQPRGQQVRPVEPANVQKSHDLSAGSAPPVSTRDDLHRRGSNPVAAAMTDQLVKESAKLDPALPPPTMPAVPAAPAPPTTDASNHRGSNPVAAAMTDQLVKESARLDAVQQPPNAPASQ